MRPGPATRAASFVDLSSCLLAARNSEPTLLVRQRPPGCYIYQYQLQNVIQRITAPQPLRWPPAQPVQRAGEEAAMPGQPARARARFRMSPGNSPSRIASLPPVSPQSSFNKTESSHVFADPLWGRMLRTATKKHFALVQKLWRMRVPCGRLRKSENEIALVS